MLSPPVTTDGLAAGRPLVRAFYQRYTVAVAADLLGKLVVRRTAEGVVAVRLTEVEAYLGPDDPACHTYGGRRTTRVQTMWGEAGRAYVYLVYGLHHCLNVVTVGEGAGEAVLLRGGEAAYGVSLMRRRRGGRIRDDALCNGPGKLGQALAISLTDDGRDLCSAGSGLWIVDDGADLAGHGIRRLHRVGVGYAGSAAGWLLRFVVAPG